MVKDAGFHFRLKFPRPGNPRKPGLERHCHGGQVFWPRLPGKAGLRTKMARKASLLWPGLPRKLGGGHICQALPDYILPASSVKSRESLAH